MTRLFGSSYASMPSDAASCCALAVEAPALGSLRGILVVETELVWTDSRGGGDGVWFVERYVRYCFKRVSLGASSCDRRLGRRDVYMSPAVTMRKP